MGERIKAKRMELGMSQSVLAEKVGISRVQISNLERGESKNMHGRTAMAIAQVLGITMDYLFFGTTD